MEEPGAEDASNDEPDYSSAGSYEVQDEWGVLDDPAPTSEEWDAMKGTNVWTTSGWFTSGKCLLAGKFLLLTTRPQQLSSGELVQFSFMGAQGRCHDLELENTAHKASGLLFKK